MVKVLIVEDHDMARMGLSVILSKNPNIEIADMSADGQEGVDKALQLKPDVVIMDIGLPSIDGIEATRKIKSVNSNIKVLMYTSREEEDDIFDSFKAGADGYITKGATSEQTIAAVMAVSEGAAWLDPAIAKVVLRNVRKSSETQTKRGEINYKLGKNLYGLTEREMEVLALIVDGMSNPQISEKLVITLATTKTHVHSILQKLYVESRSKAVATAMKEGLV
ncbi:MAG: response regulator transcription factor [Cyanobacteria bacterium SIG32]|nr:response regulator transcription factor [Cyanobacteria bacterium SIG32]